MSLQLLGKVFNIQGVKPSAKGVLLSLANHAWDDGTHAHPSRGLIAHETSRTIETVRVALLELLEEGLIREVGATSLGVKVYALNVDKIDTLVVEYIPKIKWGNYPEMPQILPTPAEILPTPAEILPRTLIKPLDNKEQKILLETENLYLDLVFAWGKTFPKRVQPRGWATASAKLKGHVAARSKEPDFMERWKQVMWGARNSALADAGWFTLEYFTRNEDNWKKIEAGTFDFLGAGSVAQHVAVAPDITIEQWQNRRK